MIATAKTRTPILGMRILALEIAGTVIFCGILFLFIIDPFMLPVITERPPVYYPTKAQACAQVKLHRYYTEHRDCTGVGVASWHHVSDDGSFSTVQKTRSWPEGLNPGFQTVNLTLQIPCDSPSGKLIQRFKWVMTCWVIPIEIPMSHLEFEVTE